MKNTTTKEVDAWIAGRGPQGHKNQLRADKNLYLTRKASGDPVWILRYRNSKGIRKEYTIGRHALVGGLAGARNLALDLTVRVNKGEDIAITKRKEKYKYRAAQTYKDLLDDYCRVNEKRLTPTTLQETQRMQKRDVLAKIGSMSILIITHQDIINVVQDINDRSYTVARRVWEQLSTIFSHAVTSGTLDKSPISALNISSIIGYRAKRRERKALTEDELKVFLNRLKGEREVNALAVKILLYSAVRKSELLNSKWENIDFENGVWTIPDDLVGNKSKRAHQIPLSPVALGWFIRLRELAGNSVWVLPAQACFEANRHKPMSLSTLNLVFKRLQDGMRHFSPHDCRSTARTHFASMGYGVFVVERALNHSVGGLIAVYDKNAYWDERKSMLEVWANRLQQFEDSIAP